MHFISEKNLFLNCDYSAFQSSWFPILFVQLRYSLRDFASYFQIISFWCVDVSYIIVNVPQYIVQDAVSREEKTFFHVSLNW